MSKRPCILFLVNSLAAGGAERQLCELARNMDADHFEIHVVATYDPGKESGGELWEDMAAIPGVQLHSLHKRHGAIHHLVAIPRLMALVHRLKPDVLHGYMDGNLPILLMGLIFRKPVVWGIRRSSADFTTLDPLSIRLLRLLIRLSPLADMVIFNSQSGLRSHRAMGMQTMRMTVIPNGFDTQKFHPDATLGATLRAAWGIPPHTPLIGIVGRLHEVKDHPTFLRMAARIHKELPETRFVCVGGGSPHRIETLRNLADSLGIADRVLWPGVIRDMSSVYNALSVLVLSSTDEGFPNVIGEAMACGVPCVSTRVGDAEALIGHTGHTCEPGDADGLAKAVIRILEESADDRSARSRSCRSRITIKYSSIALARSTEDALARLLPGHPRPSTFPPGMLTMPLPMVGLRTSKWDKARYLLRIDDLCPTIDWSLWNALEAFLIEHQVKPILAVIPDNRDPSLFFGPPAPDFWDRVRKWQAMGWSICLHGYQHTYVNDNPGILRRGRKSEFAGLSYREQLDKLRRGMEIFAREGVRVDGWVAPGHSFDWATVAALSDLGVHIISDGTALAPYLGPGSSRWIPQQFAHIRRMPFGVWTFCYHLVEFTPDIFEEFKRTLPGVAREMVTLPVAAAMAGHQLSLFDRALGPIRSTLSTMLRGRNRKPSFH